MSAKIIAFFLAAIAVAFAIHAFEGKASWTEIGVSLFSCIFCLAAAGMIRAIIEAGEKAERALSKLNQALLRQGDIMIGIGNNKDVR
ncbi:MAG: hypothetical protein AAB495_02315 [Patescibacteria group bacterium]